MCCAKQLDKQSFFTEIVKQSNNHDEMDETAEVCDWKKFFKRNCRQGKND